jgi:hypothetical protein
MVRDMVMRVFQFCCPKTGHKIDPGIEDVDLAATPMHFSALYVRCRHCGDHHEIKIEEAALTEAA